MSTDPFEKWLVVLLIRGGGIAITWCAIGWFLRNLSAGRVSAWWRGGVLALLAIAILPPDLALLRIPVATRARVVESTAIVVANDIEVSTVPAALSSIAPRPPLKSPMVWWTWVWLAGAVVLGSRLLLSQLRVAALIRTAKHVQDPKVLALLPGEAGRNRRAPRVELKMHPGITTPFASGLFRRVIVLPESALSQPDHLRMMIRHEWAHFKRGDVVAQLLAEIAAALHWPNPFVWILKRRMRSAQEAAADDQVLSAGFDGPSYASLLFEAAANECRSAREPMAVPMARVSTLRHRIGLLLDTTRSREIAHPLLRYGLLGLAGVAAVTLGFGTLRAEPENESSVTWSRRYRDTLRLENSFADRFGGTSTEALAAFRKDLESSQAPVSESVVFELSPDKRTLVIDFADGDRPVIESKLLPVMSKAGWWRDPEGLRQKSVERVLAPLRARAQEAATEVAGFRDAQKIVDSDPEDSNGVVWTADSRFMRTEQQVLDLRKRVAVLEDQSGRLGPLKELQILDGLRIVQLEDPRIQRMHESLLDAVADRARLSASGVGKNHPRLKATVSFIEVLEGEMTKELTKLKTDHAKKLESEKQALAQAENEFEKASKKQIEDKAHVGAYLKAKAEYLRRKRVYEAAQIKYEIEDLESARLKGGR